MTANFATAFLTLAAGWIALLPLRHTLPPPARLLAGLPVGLLVWPGVAAITTATGWRWSPVVVAACAGFVLAFLARLVRPRPADTAGRGWAWDICAGALGVAVAAFVSMARLSTFSEDSWLHYEPLGVLLHDSGRVSSTLMAHRNILLPAVHALGRLVGTEWTYAVYPLIAMEVVALVAAAAWWTSEALLRRARLAIVAGTCGLMATTAPFIFHTFYVHSHMVSAMYLLLALIAIERASRHGRDRPTAEGAARWLAIGGLSAAGLSLSRPDGGAYVCVVLMALAAVHLRRQLPAGRLAAFYVPFGATVGLVLAAAIAHLGFWTDPLKASAFSVLVTFAVAVASWPLLVWISKTSSLSGWLSRRLWQLVLAANALVVLLLSITIPERLFETLKITGANLFLGGQYNSLAFVAVGTLGLAWASARLRRQHRWAGVLVASCTQFYVIAMALHAVAASSRPGWGDSLSRVAFHGVPIVFWLFALMWSNVIAASYPALRAAANGRDSGPQPGMAGVGSLPLVPHRRLSPAGLTHHAPIGQSTAASGTQDDASTSFRACASDHRSEGRFEPGTHVY